MVEQWIAYASVLLVTEMTHFERICARKYKAEAIWKERDGLIDLRTAHGNIHGRDQHYLDLTTEIELLAIEAEKLEQEYRESLL